MIVLRLRRNRGSAVASVEAKSLPAAAIATGRARLSSKVQNTPVDPPAEEAGSSSFTPKWTSLETAQPKREILDVTVGDRVERVAISQTGIRSQPWVGSGDGSGDSNLQHHNLFQVLHQEVVVACASSEVIIHYKVVCVVIFAEAVNSETITPPLGSLAVISSGGCVANKTLPKSFAEPERYE